MTCRICLISVGPSKSRNIFTEGRTEELISDLIMNFAYVEVLEEDYLPKIVCSECLNRLLDVYNFKDLIIKSDAYLRGTQDLSSDSDVSENNYSEESVGSSQFEVVQMKTEPIEKVESCQFEPIIQMKIESNAKVEICDKNNTVENVDNDYLEAKSESKQFKFENLSIISSDLGENSVDKAEKLTRKGYKCSQCNELCRTRYILILHKATHTGKFPHSCDVCNKGFPTNWAMHVHRRIHFEERPFKCEICEKSFKTKSSQISHRRIHLGEKRYECKICGKKYAQIGGLISHRHVHTDQKPFMCESCGKYFTSKRSLDLHFKKHTGESTQPCPICGKLFFNVPKHIKNIHADEDKRIRFPCELCSKTFTTKVALRIHMRIHEDVKPFSCDICGKSFRQSSVATLHKRVHTGEKPFPCSLCDRKFAYKHHLKKHVERDHPDKEKSLLFN